MLCWHGRAGIREVVVVDGKSSAVPFRRNAQVQILIRPSSFRPAGVIDSWLANFLGIETKALNQAAKRSLDLSTQKTIRYQMTSEEYRSFRASQSESSAWGGRRYRPYVYTFAGVCMVIARLRLNLSLEKGRALLSMFGVSDFPLIDYGRWRLEELFTHSLREILNGIATVKIHRPVMTPAGLYFIDAYIEDAKLAIEIDENHHRQSVAADTRRQLRIERALRCKFIRVKRGERFATLLNRILKHVLQKPLPTKQRNPRQEPRAQDILDPGLTRWVP